MDRIPNSLRFERMTSPGCASCGRISHEAAWSLGTGFHQCRRYREEGWRWSTCGFAMMPEQLAIPRHRQEVHIRLTGSLRTAWSRREVSRQKDHMGPWMVRQCCWLWIAVKPLRPAEHSKKSHQRAVSTVGNTKIDLIDARTVDESRQILLATEGIIVR